MNIADLPKEELFKLEALIKLEIYNRRLVEIRKAMNTRKFTFSQLLIDKMQLLEHIVSHELSSVKRMHLIENYLEELEIILDLDQ